MIDIHCHILPGIDDGSPDTETSLKMAEIAVKDGIRTIIATPHIRPGMSGDDILRAVNSFQLSLDEAHIPLKILPGGEIPFGLLQPGVRPVTLAGSSYILVEFLPDLIPDGATDTLRSMVLNGYQVIIAHPERNYVFMERYRTLEKMLSVPGVHTQITAMSVKGSFGNDIKSFSQFLLKKNWVDFIASDAHDARFRMPELSFLLTHRKNKKYLHLLDPILNHHSETIIQDGHNL